MLKVFMNKTFRDILSINFSAGTVIEKHTFEFELIVIMEV